MSKKFPKTNVMRHLDQEKINYRPLQWDIVDDMSQATQSPVFKTLVTVGHSGDHYVFVVPVDHELDLKKAAEAVGEKKIQMIKQKELLPLTGYLHGGCSPIGMKKVFSTVFDQQALDTPHIIFSAGKVGFSVEMAVADIEKVIDVTFNDVTTA